MDNLISHKQDTDKELYFSDKELIKIDSLFIELQKAENTIHFIISEFKKMKIDINFVLNYENSNIEKTFIELQSKGIITSLRQNRAGLKFIRVSPHFYNTDDELHRFLDYL